MKFKTVCLFALFSLLFLFYPGDSTLFHTFSYHRSLFSDQNRAIAYANNPVPIRNFDINPEITAESAYIVDRKSFSPVYEKNAHKHMFPASTAKMITALVAYDIYKADSTIKLNSVLEDGQVMGLVQGEEISIENLLYGTLVHSGNDAAYALAQPIGLTAFVAKMNEKAQALHMYDTHFENPAGLHNPAQHSSAFDLALAGRTLLNNPYLSKIVSTKEIEISDTQYRIFHKLVNVNKLLGEIPGVGGLKTGYTIESGENLVSLYRTPDGHEFIIVVLNSLDRFEDTKTIVNWINSNVSFIVE
ncbi:MAG: serine hydrolase [Microgenomates group bacterium]